MGAQHSPAPFTSSAEEDGCSVAYRIRDANGWAIGATYGCDSAEAEAGNAALWAAAPELLIQLEGLLAAARLIVSAVDIDPETTNVDFRANGQPIAKVHLSTLFANAGAAIAKATEA